MPLVMVLGSLIFVAALFGFCGYEIGYGNATRFWSVTELPHELKTMTVWKYGPYKILMAPPGGRLVRSDDFQKVVDNEDEWRSPLWK